MFVFNHGQKFLSTPAPHRVTSPANCLILGLLHPPKLPQSENEGLLSQWAYQSCCEATEGQADRPPMMVCHMQAVAQIAGTLPLDLILLIISVTKAQLLLVSPDQPHPELGLVSTSIQIMPQRLPGILAIISSTCAEALLPLHGNMQISVIMPAPLALFKFCTALWSSPPQEQQPRRMTNSQPLLFMHWQVEVEKS